MEVSCLFHAPAAIYLEKEPRYSLDTRFSGSQSRSGRCREKSLDRAGNRKPVVQPISRRYTDLAYISVAPKRVISLDIKAISNLNARL